MAAKIIKMNNKKIEFRLAGRFDKNISSLTNDEFKNLLKQGFVNYIGYKSSAYNVIKNCKYCNKEFRKIPSSRENPIDDLIIDFIEYFDTEIYPLRTDPNYITIFRFISIITIFKNNFNTI